MPVKTLKQLLDREKVKYVTIIHSPAYTAQEVAASAHVSGKHLAKTVMVECDGKLAMAVVPASSQVDLALLEGASAAGSVELAEEKAFAERFPGCDVGAIPPFGNLYGMDVYFDEALTEDDEIAFSAGTHTELLKLDYRDYERLVHPKVARISSIYA
jgi:Ala-tRNA(Pro) deacylase